MSEPEQDPLILDLVEQICTRVGMIMEDASVDALLKTSDGAIGERVEKLRTASQQSAALVLAAKALLVRRNATGGGISCE